MKLVFGLFISLMAVGLGFVSEVVAEDPGVAVANETAVPDLTPTPEVSPSPSSTPTASERGPRELVEEMLLRLKATHEPAVILDYIHWPSAYAAYPESETKLKQINTPQELEAYMRAVLTDPQGYLHDQLERRIKRLPEEMATKLRASTRQVLESMALLKERMAQRISETEYKIGKFKMQGNDAAEVELIAVLDGDERNTTVKLVKIDGRWYLPTVDYAKGEGGQL